MSTSTLLLFITIFALSVHAQTAEPITSEHGVTISANVLKAIEQWVANHTARCQVEGLLLYVNSPNSDGSEGFVRFDSNSVDTADNATTSHGVSTTLVKTQGKWQDKTTTAYDLIGSYVQFYVNGSEVAFIGGLDSQNFALGVDQKANTTFKVNNTDSNTTTTVTVEILPGVLTSFLPDDTFSNSNCSMICCNLKQLKSIIPDNQCANYIIAALDDPDAPTSGPCAKRSSSAATPQATGADGQPVSVNPPVPLPATGSTPTAAAAPGSQSLIVSCTQDDPENIACGHGFLNQTTCQCQCVGAYTGTDCNTCPFDASYCTHGTFDDCSCKCNATENWSGAKCDVCSLKGPNGFCYALGNETHGLPTSDCTTCTCFGQYMPPYCTHCNLTCGRNMKQDAACTQCLCAGLWQGANCDQCGLQCAAGQGVPNSACSACVCSGGWSGAQCDQCSLQCGAHGSPDSKCLYCQCKDGYQGQQCQNNCGNGIVDPNEECDGQSYCSSACRLLPGYACSNGVCGDVDECASASTNKCPANYVCTNTVGSYTCACPPDVAGCVVVDPHAHNSYPDTFIF